MHCVFGTQLLQSCASKLTLNCGISTITIFFWFDKTGSCFGEIPLVLKSLGRYLKRRAWKTVATRQKLRCKRQLVKDGGRPHTWQHHTAHWSLCTLDSAQCSILHTGHKTVHTAHCAHCTLHTRQCTHQTTWQQHTAHYKVHNTRSTSGKTT